MTIPLIKLKLLSYFQCSYFHCDSSSYEKRLEDATAFSNDHQRGSNHDCYFGKKDNAGRALKKIITSNDLIAGVIISVIITLAGIIICVIMAIVDKTKDSKTSPDVPPSEENLKQAHESDDSDIETIEISTTITTVSTKSGKDSVRSGVPSGSPLKRNASYSGHQ